MNIYLSIYINIYEKFVCVFMQAIFFATYMKESIFSMLIDIFSVDKILIARNNVPFMRTNKTFMLDKNLINGSWNILTKVRFKTLIKFLFIGIEKRLTAPIIYFVYYYLILSKKKDISSISYRFLVLPCNDTVPAIRLTLILKLLFQNYIIMSCNTDSWSCIVVHPGI